MRPVLHKAASNFVKCPLATWSILVMRYSLCRQHQHVPCKHFKVSHGDLSSWQHLNLQNRFWSKLEHVRIRWWTSPQHRKLLYCGTSPSSHTKLVFAFTLFRKTIVNLFDLISLGLWAFSSKWTCGENSAVTPWLKNLVLSQAFVDAGNFEKRLPYPIE